MSRSSEKSNLSPNMGYYLHRVIKHDPNNELSPYPCKSGKQYLDEEGTIIKGII